jgi:tyrosyl-tRNA synthetase
MVLKRLALAGHPVYAVVGGITGLIGDPKPSQERQMQAIETIKSNAVALGKQLTKYAKAKKVCNNLDFYRGMTVYEYLRDIGKLININYILEKEIIARRLATGISYAEFSYTILQGYDFLYLFEHEKVTCQAGGSDQ